MGGVDKADQYIQYYCYHQKTLKWPKKVFFSLLEMVKFNAYRLFTLSPNHSSNLTFLQFSCLLIKGLINGYSAGIRRGRPLLAPDQRLIQRHMPTTLNSKGRCHVCYMRQKNGKQDNIRQTKYGCSVCGKHLYGNAEMEEEFNPYPTSSDPFDFDALLKQAKNKMSKR
ncbi:unnamed protein product [Mytilus edulis]|uniref:PiggyBac transposable element-derived protein domain-containing protein n=1 Tax=Mytilus edulis TaxID=6550 RepID=A0A8S3SSD5_MYTED|nr:unnamed protein product [Mytilus edulis]